MRVAFVPPNPNELDIATLTDRSFILCGTRSISHPSVGLSKFRVGGTILSLIANKEKTVQKFQLDKFGRGAVGIYIIYIFFVYF